MRKKIISLFLLLAVVAATLLAACAPITEAGNNNNEITSPVVTEDLSHEIGLLRTDLKLSQDQMLSRIKAKKILENGGYADDDEIVVVLSLPGDSLIDTFLADGGSTYASVADYAVSEAGQKQAAAIAAEQDALIEKLTADDSILGVTHCYSTVANAIAVRAKYGKFDKLSTSAGVTKAILSDTYNLPQNTSADDASAINNAVDVYPTGIYNSGSVDYTGKGTVVAILDSGFDCSHEVFARQPDVPYSKLGLNQQKISGLLSQTRAAGFTHDIDLMDVWYSNKIPYTYDYADKDTDVFPYDSEHGTHVAGIIGGSSKEITGVAVDCQLVLMKVFPDLEQGADTDDILAALEDAVLLGVDAINMSLGSSCGFARETDEDATNEIYDKIGAAGISLLTAASNDYSSGFGGEQGNTNFVTNPDSATVGSPSTYASSLSVASISGTKSPYLVGNGSQVIFYDESNAVTGKPNDFFGELKKVLADSGKWNGEGTFELEYVTVPGIGMKANYTGLDMNGKIALVKRGDTTFEEKALQAKTQGAIACIIYNNIDGDILMSMGKTDHIPTVSISKDAGTMLAEHETGKIAIDPTYVAGPFMSDFSSWGPCPDLTLKPEITAHGGNIHSAIPGYSYDDEGKIIYCYDDLSGTSMATPNLCGVVLLIRQYIRDSYPELSWKEVNTLCNQLLMSTATIALNEEGVAYSPRKQGAGLASLGKLVKSGAYIITVDKNGNDMDKTKIELFDDPERTGVYTMNFKVQSLADHAISYDLGLIAMTESVSTSDEKHVSETGHLLSGSYVATVSGEGCSYADGELTVSAGKTAEVTLVYTLSDEDKEYINVRFPYGMFVEGYVTLTAVDTKEVDINAPFLAFYGDWTQAPIFDKTYYEVESEAHDAAIDDEDKIKADYYATTPYGSYYYNYIIPLGAYLYDIDTDKFDKIPASPDHIAVGDMLGTIDGISAVYAGVLRNSKYMTYTITDKLTGEVVKELVVENSRKAASNGGTPIPNYEYLKWKSAELGLVNNRQYTFSMVGKLDYGDGGKEKNVRNSFSFDFVLDNEAPVIKSCSYEKEYDTNKKKDRFYITMEVYDNQYTMAITPIIFTSSSSYATLGVDPIPVYGERGEVTSVRFEVTDYLDEIYSDSLITSALAFAIEDYALNSNLYICQLPGTKGDFKFTKTGDAEGEDLSILTVNKGEVIDLVSYLWSSDESNGTSKDYLKYLAWTSSDTDIVSAAEGQIHAKEMGIATVSVTEAMEGKKAVLIIRVKDPDAATEGDSEPAPEPESTSDTPALSRSGRKMKTKANDDKMIADEIPMKEIRFSYFETKFAYSRAAQTSEIGSTGSRIYLDSLKGRSVNFYPGESIQLFYDIDPWFVAERYTLVKLDKKGDPIESELPKLTFRSSNPSVVKVTEDGTVTALKEGRATVTLSVEGSNLMATVNLTVKNPFVIENRTLIAYKGIGGKVEIPDDEGILYIGAYAFCLYTTDYSIELSDDDYDANKLPATNTTITEVVIPEGVEDIQKYAFYNCTGLKKVTLPKSAKFVREYCFYNDESLEEINLFDVETIGARAFYDCNKLNNIDIRRTYAIGMDAFAGCESLTSVDITALRNAGSGIFRKCSALKEVKLNADTKLSIQMFASSGLESITLEGFVKIPEYFLANCKQLASVTIGNGADGYEIGYGALCQCPKLTSVTLQTPTGDGRKVVIGEQVFYDDDGLTSFSFPNSEVEVGNYAFTDCSALAELVIGSSTHLAKIDGCLFGIVSTNADNFDDEGKQIKDLALETFSVDAENPYYAADPDNHLLMDKAGETVIFAAVGHDFGDYTLPAVKKIANGAFSGAKITKLTVPASVTEIGDCAFSLCSTLAEVVIDPSASLSIGTRCFGTDPELKTVENMDKITGIGNYAFFGSALESAKIGDGVKVGEGAFFQVRSLKEATIGKNVDLGLGAFERCNALVTVNMPAEGGVHIGNACFAYATALKKIDLSKTDKDIEYMAFYFCSSLPKADLANVETIGDYAFADCAALNILNLPKIVKIGQGAFARYDANGGAPIFQSLVLPETLEYLGDGCFSGLTRLSEIVIPDNEKLITSLNVDSSTKKDEDTFGRYIFAYCTNLQKVTLPSSLERIGTFNFAGCTILEEINLENIKYFEDYALTSCQALKNVVLTSAETLGIGVFADTGLSCDIVANDLVSMDMYAFQGAGLTSFEARKLEKIGQGAFQNNKSLTEFIFSPALKEIGDGAFLDCDKLAKYGYYTESGVAYEGKINDHAAITDGLLYTKVKENTVELSSVPTGKDVEILTVKEGTSRVSAYAAADNKKIKKIVFPDTLEVIGNYAFYGCDVLKTVEFRSVTAPALECSYIPTAILENTDPGFELLHNQFDLYGLEMYYYTFKDLVGKKSPIQMIVPANKDIVGYDSLIYEVYFGKLADAERSEYTARETALIEFTEYAKEIMALDKVRTENADLINKASSALNLISQDPTAYGYLAEDWSKMVDAVKKAKADLSLLTFSNAPLSVQRLQKTIDDLPDSFSPDLIGTMDDIAVKLALMVRSDKDYLSLGHYKTLLAEYNEYKQEQKDNPGPVEPDKPDEPDEPDEPDHPDHPDTPDQPAEPEGLSAVAIVLIVIGGVIVLAGAGFAIWYFVLNKKSGAAPVADAEQEQGMSPEADNVKAEDEKAENDETEESGKENEQ